MGGPQWWFRVAGSRPATVDTAFTGDAPGTFVVAAVVVGCLAVLFAAWIIAIRAGAVPTRRTPVAAEERPAPSLSRLETLVGSFAEAGQQVRWKFAGPPRPLPAEVDVAAYRIIEESLAGVRRHAGDAAASVRLRYHPAGLTIEVRDDGGAGGAERVLPCTRERAESLGGRFSAGPGPEGGFVVHVELPAPEEPAGDAPDAVG